ncbi:MAG: tRNA (N6-threonylcarbamoyladenosine(37)-N6)-methyltransferase TrmO [Phototrophicaceae bacterium]|jgi:tRNA-Thr(GGU) m(6)t(6)A37 methyltransferase TsaA
MQAISLYPIGHVETAFQEGDPNWRKSVSTLVIDPAYARGLTGLENWSHLVVIFSMHMTTFDAETHLLNRPAGRDDMPETGVFAQRSHLTPNTLGMTVVKLLRVEHERLTVQGLDALDGTPILDIKPYAPVYDGAADPLVPVWFLRLMQG